MRDKIEAIFQAAGTRPVLWVGAELGFAPPHRLRAHLAALLPALANADDAVRRFVEEAGLGALIQQLQTLIHERTSEPIHRALMRLVGAGIFRAVVTTNPDRLLEEAARLEGIAYHVVAFTNNSNLAGRDEPTIFKIHGDLGDWASHVLAARESPDPPMNHTLLALDLLLSQHPVLYVGTAPTDIYLRTVLQRLDPQERRLRLPGLMLVSPEDLTTLPSDVRTLMTEANLRPLEVANSVDLETLFVRWAEHAAPPAKRELVFTLEAETFSVVGPGGAYTIVHPLKDQAFRKDLALFQRAVATPVSDQHPDASTLTAELRNLALRLGRQLTAALLNDAAVAQVCLAMTLADSDPPRLTLVVPPGPGADEALALPWELLMPEADRFAVEEARLDLVRAADLDGPLVGAPATTLGIAVSVAAPEGVDALNFEEESYRLIHALHGHSVTFADLGTRADFVAAVEDHPCNVLHFSGHGQPGQLLFEDDYGLPDPTPIEHLVRDLKARLPSGRPLPRVFFLATCHGNSGTSTSDAPEAAHTSELWEIATALGQGPSTAATLHRGGFTHVIGYFGPVGQHHCTRAEEVWYGALAAGRPLLQAARMARLALAEPLEPHGVKFRFPLAFAQLAVYHRGPDGPLVRHQRERPTSASRFRRRLVQVNGLPTLERGFIGRRALLHELRRRWRDGQRLFVLQGLGGLGKTALAMELITRVFKAEDPLVLPLAEAVGVARIADAVYQHGFALGLPGWEAIGKAINEQHEGPVARFEALVTALRRHRPFLVLYADNAESLQQAPKPDTVEAVRDLGAWVDADTQAWWKALEALGEDGCIVLISTRYGWPNLSPRHWIRVPPMGQADLLRMAQTFEHLGRLPFAVLDRIAKAADGRPRTLEYLDRLLAPHEWDDLPDVWKALIAPLFRDGRLTTDLMLDALWSSLSPAAQAHAGRLTALLMPAPRPVTEALGTETDALMRAGLLTRHRIYRTLEGRRQWQDRFGLQAEVRRFVMAQRGAPDANTKAEAGRAWDQYLDALNVGHPDDGLETIRLFHEAGEGDAAWKHVEVHVSWMHAQAYYSESLALLEASLASNTTADRQAKGFQFMAHAQRAMGHPESVSKLLTDAITVAESDEVRLDIRHEQASVSMALGKYEDAEGLLEGAIQQAESLWGKDHPAIALPLHTLAFVRIRQARYPEAERAIRRSISIRGDSAGVGASLSVLANALLGQGKREEAEAAMIEAFDLAGTHLRPGHPDRGTALEAMAGFLQDPETLATAHEVLVEALRIKHTALGSDHPSYGETEAFLAITLLKSDRYSEALGYAEHAVKVFQDSYKEPHSSTGKALFVLSIIQDHLDLPAASESMFKAVAILDSSLGARHPETVAARTAIGWPPGGRNELAGRWASAWSRGVEQVKLDQFEAAVLSFTEAINAAREAQAAVAETSAWAEMAAVLLPLGRWAEARHAATKAHDMAVLNEIPREVEMCARMIAEASAMEVLYPMGGRVAADALAVLEAAQEAAGSALGISEKVAHLRVAIGASISGRFSAKEAQLQSRLAGVLAFEGDKLGAEIALKRAQLLADVMGDTEASDGFAQQRSSLDFTFAEGLAHLQAERFAEAFESFSKAVKTADEPARAGTCQGALGEALIGLGRWADAQEALLQAEQFAIEARNPEAATYFSDRAVFASSMARLYPAGGPVSADADERMQAAIEGYRASHDLVEEEVHLRVALEAAASGRFVDEEIGLLEALAGGLVERGEAAGAKIALERARLIAELTGLEEAEAHFATQLASLVGADAQAKPG